MKPLHVVVAVAMLTAAIPAGAITPVAATLPASSQTTINNGSGNQTDPHVSGDLVAFTADAAGGLTEIQYFDFTTNSLNSISNAASFDLLPDVGASTIVFTRVGSGKQAIYAFDVSAGQLVELDPVAASRRRGSVIGGGTVAWVDLSTGSLGEIYVYDMATGAAAQALTNDSLVDRRLAVSPDGSVIVWEKCASATANCDIYQAVRSAGGWTVTALTNTSDHESFPDTNGTIVVYGSNRAGSVGGADIYWTPVGGGPETQLELAGVQRNPNISGNLVVFEGQPQGAPTFDLFAYDISTNNLYQLTNTSALDETLNDVSVSASGQVRVVWSVFEGADTNVYGLSFQLPPPLPPERVTISPVSSVNPVGTRHTVATMVTDRTGALVGGATVVIQVTGSVTMTAQCITGGNWQCGFTYLGPQTPGTDVILVFVDLNGNGVLDTPNAIGPCPFFPCDFGEPWAVATKIWVASSTDAIDELIALVDSLNTSRGTATSLRTKLQAARRAADDGNTALACRMLDAFKREVQTQAGKTLTTAEANQLLAAADAVKAALGCP